MAKDTKDGNNLNEKSYVNKKLLQCYLIISMVLLAAYIMELVKGNRTAGYVFVFSIILIVPVIMALYRDRYCPFPLIKDIVGRPPLRRR